ncbi:hypothetical protein WKW72_19680 [Vibrio alginolyticus]|uniref:tetratricopeptide repeat protein n=2 Tax=Vibrio alginolyticus TaxID=663 RepID=UPI0037541927
MYAKPISRTVDFSTNNFKVVGQCGTDSEYFDVFSRNFDELIKLKLNNTKPIKDINSTLKNSSQCSKIILFANQEAKGGRLDNVNKVIHHIGIKQDVDVIDSEQIAEIVFDNIANQKLVLSLIDYLPTAGQIYSAISLHNELPPLPADFVVRKEEDSIVEMIKNNQVSAIHGVSGIGKSKVALGVAHKLYDEFDSVIWVNLGEGKKFDFKSVKVGDFDKNLNLANLCETYKTLVILDNFFGNADELESNFCSFANPNSRIIITSIERPLGRKNSFHLSEMDESESRSLIRSHINIDDDQIESFISNIGGHPLCLELVCQIIQDEEYDETQIYDFIKEIEQIPEEIVKGRSQSISDLVIGKHSDRFHREFTLLSLLNSEQVSNYILNKTLGTRAIRNLEKTSLIVRSGINFSTIHSIVLLSINNLYSNNQEKTTFRNKISDLLLVENEFKRSDYYSFCVLHHEFLKDLYNENLSESRRKALLYAIIQTTDNLVNKSSLIKEIDNFTLDNNKLEDLLLLIERFELELISIDRKSNEEEYQNKSNEAIDILEEIISNLESASNLELLVKHHIAKLHYWKGNTSTSQKLFKDILKEFPDSEQCILQLARISDNEKEYKDASDYVDLVLGKKTSNQSHSIVLSFYDLIANSQYKKSREKYIDSRIEEFISDISITLRSSFDHPYRVLSSLSSHLGYNFKDEFRILCENLPAPDNVNQNEKLMIAYANIQMALYRLYKYNNFQEKEEKLRITATLAEKYYLESNPSNDFDNLKVAKFYNEIGNYSKSSEFLDKIENQDQFYFQTKAKQLKGVGDFHDALIAVNKAIEIEKDDKNRHWFLSSFLNDKAEILNLDQNNEAIEVLKEAIGIQRNFNTKKSWERKLSQWEDRM